MSLACNYDDVMRQLQSRGMIIDKPLLLDSQIQRWKVAGEDREKRGWTRLREWMSKSGAVYIVGAHGIWHGNDDGYTKVAMPDKDSQEAPLSKEDIAAIAEANKEAARRIAEVRKQEAKTAGAWAAIVWSNCQPVENHEYLTRKQIQPHGTRLLESTDGMVFDGIDDTNKWRLSQAIGALVVPMHDENGNVCGVQFVYGKGHKRREKIDTDKEFWPTGMAMAGSFGIVGPLRRTGVSLVTEGFATACSLHESTGHSVVYAFSANNLLKAAKSIRKKNPKLRLLFCADDDAVQHCAFCKAPTWVHTPICSACGKTHMKSNGGVEAAVAANAALEMTSWIKPVFVDESGKDLRGEKPRKGVSDFNDLAVLSGSPLLLAHQINGKLDELGWREASSVPPSPTQQGGGDGRLPALSVMSLDDAVGRFIPLDDGTGKYLFDTRTSRVVHKDQMLALLPAGVRADDVKRHPLWQSRGAYYLDQVGFDPAGDDKSVKLNTWKGWPIEPREGRCGELLTLISYLCSGESSEKASEINLWLLRWMAYPLQHPGAKMASAVIMHGPQGTGKSTAFEVLAKIYGKGHSNPQMNYSVWLDQKALQDNFNADWENKLFVLAEEVVNGSDKWQLKNELKAVVSSETIRIRKVFTDGYPAKNRVNLVFLSNEDQPLPIENDDRRHLVIYTPPQLEEAFYDRVFYEIENGGIEAFYHYLMNLDLGDFHPKKKPPMTEAKQDLIWLSMPSEKRFMRSWIAGDLDLPFCPCLGNHLYIAYRKYCEQEGETRPRNRTQFISMLGKGEFSAWRAGQSVPVRESMLPNAKTKNRKMVIPPDEVMQQVSLRIGPGETNYAKRPDDPQALWLCEGYLAFKDAAGIKDEDD